MRNIRKFRFTLTKSQSTYFAAFLKTIAEGIVLGSSTAFFLPEALQLKQSISVGRYIFFMLIGLTCLFGGVILEKKGKYDS